MVQPNHLTVKCEQCDQTVDPETPENRLWWIIAGMAVFGGIGLALGLVTGVATAGMGFVAWIFTVPIGLYAGYKIGGFSAEYFDGYSCPNCGTVFSAPAVRTRAANLIQVGE